VQLALFETFYKKWIKVVMLKAIQLDLTLINNVTLFQASSFKLTLRCLPLVLESGLFHAISIFFFLFMVVLSAKTQDICDRIQCGDGFVCNRNNPGRPCQGRITLKIPTLITSVPTNHFTCFAFLLHITHTMLFSWTNGRRVQQSFITSEVDLF